MNTHVLRPRRVMGGMALAVALIFTAGCEWLDPTEVENPRTTTEDLAQADEPTRALLPGLRAQFARALDAVVVMTSVISDDYSIHGTGIPKDLDFPADLTPDNINFTSSFLGIYWNLQELRSLGDFVIEEIVPEDETADPADVAEVHYYRGMAFLMQAENFSALPVEQDGLPVPATQLLQSAVSDLGTAAANATGDIAAAASAALARAYRLQGDVASARAAAQQVLAADASFTFGVEYDALSIVNAPWAYLVQRALQEMQPLPRLDFLDPKYTDRESPIAVAKAEEMHLILAEADFADAAWTTGKEHLAQAIELAQGRSSVVFDDTDQRLNADLSIRPRDSVIAIRADANSPYRAGLVLDRPGTISTPIMSGSSLNADSVRAIADTETESLMHALYLARQEILLMEGRRLADLGIRLPVMRREVDSNPNLSPGDPGTTVIVPAYVPGQDEIDLFTPASPYDANGNLVDTQVTIDHDMNRALAQNRAPFAPLGG